MSHVATRDRWEHTSIATLLLVVAGTITAAVVVVAVAATVITTAVTTCGRALGGTIDLDRTTVKLLLIGMLDGSFGRGVIGIGDETEATGATYD